MIAVSSGSIATRFNSSAIGKPNKSMSSSPAVEAGISCLKWPRTAWRSKGSPTLRAAVQGLDHPRYCGSPRLGGPEDHDLSYPAAPHSRVQVLRRQCEKSDLQGRGPADARPLEDGGRRNLCEGFRLPR